MTEATEIVPEDANFSEEELLNLLPKASKAQLAKWLRLGMDSDVVRDGLPTLAIVTEECARRLEAMASMDADLRPLMEAALLYATARAKLPDPGKLLRADKDAENFTAYSVALLALERAAMHCAGKKVKQL